MTVTPEPPKIVDVLELLLFSTHQSYDQLIEFELSINGKIEHKTVAEGVVYVVSAAGVVTRIPVMLAATSVTAPDFDSLVGALAVLTGIFPYGPSRTV